MKKHKRLLFIIIPSAVIVLLAAALFILAPFIAMSPAATGPVEDTDIYAVRNSRNNLFIIPSGEEYIVIDASTDLKDVEKAFNDAGMDPADVSHVLLTHAHYDHVGALPLFANAKIYISEDELTSSSHSLPDSVRLTDLIPLSDWQEMSLGGHNVTCIKSPGYTAGSMSYILDGKYMFTGDSMKIDNNTITEHPFTEERGKAAETRVLLFTRMLELELVLTAHYGLYYPSLLTLE
ncbi:MAG: MBL fold metallo-hydrolase [Clostridiales bacterium]|jgi:glyoxylase-like metal-dependent hydrolase (beta-lactamase superfamily II)|nr:MBL fold metallo-hydrolase [Clostridiales bacterium]